MIRQRIEPLVIKSINEVWEDNWDKDFIHAMHTRMVVGGYRYSNEPITQVKRDYPYGALKAIERIKEYMLTGNVEGLIDAGNFCMIEFACSQHPKKHLATVHNRH